ncbi:hypothetical protein MCG01_04905 [Enterococcus hirae]|nr:hypothetical protein [Enterococcus hirae]
MENEIDRKIKLFTDPVASLVKVLVYHSDRTPLVSKDQPTYDLYLKADKEQFEEGKVKYEGTMTFTATFQ